ncbi:cation:proton antiporter [Ramlibacter sp. MAHUQ-53]|uniref:cation:proton antiporter n=1 Tax=unclassified Ramlibacter TaxID=2617605 RepID=UPI003634F682
MIDVLYALRDALRDTFDLTLLQWPLLLALAAAAGHLVQRRLGLPQVVGYSVVGAVAGLAGFSGAVWPLEGTGLLLLQLGVAIVLFEAGGRIALRWFRHNPMVLLQSLLEATLTFALVYFTMRKLGMAATVSEALAAIAVTGSPALLNRVVRDTRATGAVTERALVLTTLGALYALALVSARTHVIHRHRETLGDTLWPILLVLGLSVLVGLGLALALRAALRVMSPTSENTSIVLICGIAASAVLVDDLGGSAPLAALLGGIFLKQMHPRPWSWPNQLGTAASLLVMLNFVLVAVVAAQAPWNPAVAGLVLALLAARMAGKVLGVGLANAGSGLGWRQALWTACAMSPMASVALLLVSEFAAASPSLGPPVASVALPAILLMEVVGAIVATFAIYRAGETSREAATEARERHA